MNIFAYLLVLVFSMSMSSSAFASVVMTGTRIIFPGDAKEKNIQLRNTSDQPYIINIHVEDERGSDKNVPFMPTPQTFRMEAAAGQALRLLYTGNNLPQDRESVFWFSFSQLPYLNKNDKSQNQLILALTNRVKIFYRPSSIVGKSSDAPKNLTYQVKQNRIEVTNPTGYYVTIRAAELLNNGKKIPLANSVMIAPQGKTEWTLPSGISVAPGAQIHLVTVNDYGVNVTSEHAL
ncbi:molecular chaperone [Escherichia coli]|uniref:fimbrial biogenesis chaperone n=1 Tax=Escherichia coli TaxID=562 RepID=UPI0010ABF02D|nr:molecular chaperone [Escherichia coli]EFB5450166.1 molecular chaperone [Escherichia coli O157]EEX1161714.1 molecular chaperone [Escherichia coli]EFJ6805567.1 molecular chaperone [Escherichia coli]EGM8818154.1 molecular chaperone [Escherichia coli]EGN7870183.1 molecular chaperone [Escherichia coli]